MVLVALTEGRGVDVAAGTKTTTWRYNLPYYRMLFATVTPWGHNRLHWWDTNPRACNPNRFRIGISEWHDLREKRGYEATDEDARLDGLKHKGELIVVLMDLHPKMSREDVLNHKWAVIVRGDWVSGPFATKEEAEQKS